jgi:hypothetical protein
MADYLLGAPTWTERESTTIHLRLYFSHDRHVARDWNHEHHNDLSHRWLEFRLNELFTFFAFRAGSAIDPLEIWV